MHWRDGLLDPALAWSVILPVNEATWPTHTLSTYLKRLQNWQETRRIEKEFGERVRMDWSAAHQKLHRGHWKKQPKVRRVSAGQLRAMRDVYVDGSWSE